MFSKAQAESFGRELAANPVARALALSVLFHFVLISGMEVGRKAGFWKLVSRVFPENAASRALLTQLGLREVGIYKRHAQSRGVWRDVVIVEALLTES